MLWWVVVVVVVVHPGARPQGHATQERGVGDRGRSPAHAQIRMQHGWEMVLWWVAGDEDEDEEEGDCRRKSPAHAQIRMQHGWGMVAVWVSFPTKE